MKDMKMKDEIKCGRMKRKLEGVKVARRSSVKLAECTTDFMKVGMSKLEDFV